MAPPDVLKCRTQGFFFLSLFSRERREKTWLRSTNFREEKKEL